MLTLASYLAENIRPTYERIATWLTARLGEAATLLGGVAWEERLAMLDDGRVHVAFFCGWPYIQRHDRPERPVDLLCAPVMAPPRYEDRPIYFTDMVVRHDRPCSRSPISGVGAMPTITATRIPATTCPGITCSGWVRPAATSVARSPRGLIRPRFGWSRRARSTPRGSTARCWTSSAAGSPNWARRCARSPSSGRRRSRPSS